jgi:hypothetical protein
VLHLRLLNPRNELINLPFDKMNIFVSLYNLWLKINLIFLFFFLLDFFFFSVLGFELW